MIVNNVTSAANLYSAGSARYVAPASGTRNVQAKDGFTISNETQSFKAMLQKLHSESEVRQEKVEEFTQKIESGTYNVPAENIAASMLTIRF